MSTDLFRSPVLDDLKALSVELGSAIGARQGWERLDGVTFVSAARDRGRLVVVGNSGGWWAYRHDATGTVQRGPVEKATAAVKLAFKPDWETSS